LFFGLSLCQSDGVAREDVLRVDFFGLDDPNALTQVGTGTVWTRLINSLVVGVERDHILTVLNDVTQASAVVSGGDWAFSTNGNARFRLQYDGIDNSTSLNRFGLNNFNFGRQDGDAYHLAIATNSEVNFQLAMFNGDESSVIQWTANTGGVLTEFYLLYEDFIGNVDVFFTCGAVQLDATCTNGCDVVVDLFSVAAPVVPISQTEVVETSSSFTFTFYTPLSPLSTSNGSQLPIIATLLFASFILLVV